MICFNPTRPKKDAKKLTFDEAVELLIGDVYLKGQSEETIRWHRENLHVLKKTLLEEDIDTRPAKISEQILQHNFVVNQLKKGLRPNTINGRIRSFRAFFKFLHEENYIAKNVLTLTHKVLLNTALKEVFIKLVFNYYSIYLFVYEGAIPISESEMRKCQI